MDLLASTAAVEEDQENVSFKVKVEIEKVITCRFWYVPVSL